MTHETPVIDVSNSPSSCGSASTTIDESAKATPIATATRTVPADEADSAGMRMGRTLLASQPRRCAR